MNVLTRKIPAYYYDKSNLIRLVLFTAFFDLIFINIYKPFSSLTWYPVSEFKFFIFSHRLREIFCIPRRTEHSGKRGSV
mgnify:CR=1 FL=1